MDRNDVAATLCLLTLPGMGPARLRWATHQVSAADALGAIRKGHLPADPRSAPRGMSIELIRKWAEQIRRVDEVELVDNHANAGIDIISADDPHWPLSNDPEPPPLLFACGRIDLLARYEPVNSNETVWVDSQIVSSPSVAIVGTRRCSTVGRRVAMQMGLELAEAGVRVVSGLALGIDGAAHAGALRLGSEVVPAIAVVATGLDIIYPQTHNKLWEEVARRGLLLSEAPMGVGPQRWKFPARNRLIAGLSDLVVVVESHGAGGALSTVEEALARSVDVAAVPGSVLSSASEGTNALLMDGCAPVRSAQDILEMIDVGWRKPPAAAGGRPNGELSEGGVLDSQTLDNQILMEVRAGGLHLEQLIVATKRSLPEVADSVQRLQAANQISIDGSVVSVGPVALDGGG